MVIQKSRQVCFKSHILTVPTPIFNKSLVYSYATTFLEELLVLSYFLKKRMELPLQRAKLFKPFATAPSTAFQTNLESSITFTAFPSSRPQRLYQLLFGARPTGGLQGKGSRPQRLYQLLFTSFRSKPVRPHSAIRFNFIHLKL